MSPHPTGTDQPDCHRGTLKSIVEAEGSEWRCPGRRDRSRHRKHSVGTTKQGRGDYPEDGRGYVLNQWRAQ